MENFSPISASIGGAMIGLAAVWLMASVGRIAGISGILGGIIEKNGNKAWRLSFFIGLVIGPHFMAAIDPRILTIEFPVEGPFLIIGAILVGIGTQLGNGCTSGHGVCGNALSSRRSILATITFMTTGIVTVSLIKVIGGL
ncbi:MAG: YeeE/YedE thiosulfate transporter family protein [Hellea sp.]|nr:YeeE/YedE thiosulfate transporter family protein [Hellea sp.]